MKHSIFPKKIRRAFSILFVCTFVLGLLPQTSFATPSPISDGVTISAQVVSVGSVVPPTVTTDHPLVTVSDNGATLLGTLSDGGDSAVTTEGFEYGLASPSYGTTTTSTSVGFGNGQFNAIITGLVCGTTYHYRAYAENGAGRAYGTDQTFTTNDCSVNVLPVTSPGNGGILTASAVNFSGFAYPGATVTILRDGVIVSNVLADSSGAFLSPVSGIQAGSYVFSIYAKDQNGVVSASTTFPFVLNGKSVVNITNILVAPTISADKTIVQSGDTLTVSGFATPYAKVAITSKQLTTVYDAIADAGGRYQYQIDASALATGAYTMHAIDIVAGQSSPISKGILFLMGLSTTKVKETNLGCAGGDLNGDGKVDIIDYSIMKYWYKKPNPPACVDLSGDGAINLKDFSILASDWTG
ncbi:MAG: Ig-like domain-containing protein [bacterium]